MEGAPLATYRLQLGPDLDFHAAAGLVDYLAGLGVSHLYLSPILEALPGSTHGYDVADPTRVSSVLGGESGLRRLATAARDAGLGIVVDLVPNHLGTGWHTPLWRGLLEEGPTSGSGRAFDVDLTTPLPGAAGKTIVPVLGAPYGEVLHRGELRVLEEQGGMVLAYHDHRFPLSSESVAAVRRSGGVDQLAGHPQHADSWLRMHALLERQHYRLVHWRAASRLVNYRRFFSIDTLAAVRVELDDVFEHTHATILELVRDGVVDGLRIDHPDGLRDPAGYCARLAENANGTWIVVEKILGSGEELPDWPVAGTTGYDFCNHVLGLFVDPAAEAALDAIHVEHGGDPRSYTEQVLAAKYELLSGELYCDLARVTRQLWAVTQEHRTVRDVGEDECRAALAEVLVSLDVYRTYVDPFTGEATEEDVRVVTAAVDRAHERAAARGRRPSPLLDFLRELLTGRAGRTTAHLDVIARTQQVSSALMAKGVEDTVFYRYTRLTAVNEVGGEPAVLGRNVADFHEVNEARPRQSMTTTATHDTKRGEDARLRVAALSELVEPYGHCVRALAARHATLSQASVPLGAAELPLVVQTLVAVWPVGGDLATVRDRVAAYLEKALREAKLATSWHDPDTEYEGRVIALLDALIEDDEGREELRKLAERAAAIAVVSGLAQALLRITVPGVPDTYQGAESWDLSLVDPDNRRPVDFAALSARLDDSMDPAAALAEPWDGRIKQYVLRRALRARRDHPGCVGEGAAYTPLTTGGAHMAHLVAFAQSAEDQALVTVAPRLPGALMAGTTTPPVAEAWGDTTLDLPEGSFTDVLTGRALEGGNGRRASAVLAVLPVALLARS